MIVNNALYLVASRQSPNSTTVAYALRIQDGSVLWHYETQGYLTTRNMVVTAGLVYLTMGGDAPSPLLALDAATGTVRWQAHLPGKVTSTPVVANGLVIFNDSIGATMALRTATGAPVWWRPILTLDWASTLTVFHDLVYVSETDGSVAALRTNDGSERWHIHLDKIPFTLVVARDTLYAMPVEGDHPLYALHTSDGTTIWRYQSDQYPCISGIAVTVVDQVLYCLSGDASIALLDTSTGLMVQHYTMATNLLSSYPVVVGP